MGEGRYSIDVWHGCLIMQRQHLKRWSTNLWAEAKMIKRDTIALIEDLDKKSETQDVDSHHWQERHRLEVQLEEIYKKEELYWQ
jgi:hypothetical protein